jgi:tRNA A37 threonylcarbamoyladenosine dehydratase
LTTPEQAEAAQIELQAILDRHHQSLVSLIQLENGSYELTISITYEAAGRNLLNRRRSATSKIRFTIEDPLLANWRSSLKNTLTAWARQILTNSSQSITFPELEPNNCEESPS